MLVSGSVDLRDLILIPDLADLPPPHNIPLIGCAFAAKLGQEEVQANVRVS